MQLVKAGRTVQDRFARVANDAPLPDGPVLLTAERFLAEYAELAARAGSIGVLWPNSRKVSELAPHLHRLELIALGFPSFRDGRAYSQARQLREQHGFQGELRATGDILRDQFLFLLRAGFDSFEVKKPADVAAFVERAPHYTVFYQPAGDRRVSALRRRVDGRNGPDRTAWNPAGAACLAESRGP